MEFKQSKNGAILIIKPMNSRLGFSTELREVLFQGVNSESCEIIINCSQVEFFDTGFLGVVVSARKKGCKIAFCRISEALLSIFTLTGTDTIFHFFDTQKEGVEFFQAGQ